MIDLNRYLVIIPARGGSKGIPRKNIKLLDGKPLIHYTIEAAQQIFDNQQICVSSEDDEINFIAKQKGLTYDYVRPMNLATDTSSSREVILDVIEYYKNQNLSFDTIVLLQPTSPFRTSKHILEALLAYESSNCEMIVSVKESKSNPYFNLFEVNETGFLGLSKKGDYTSRQSAPKTFEYNGAIYVFSKESIQAKQFSQYNRIKKYEMSVIDSIDLDEPLDWKIAELIINENKH
jgi:CMP-N,N'-diacetyllegionaminic acid synthase